MPIVNTPNGMNPKTA